MDTHIQDDDFIVFEEREALPIVENKIIIKNEENNIKNEEENKIIIKSKKVKTTACGKRKLFPKILITRIPKNVKEGDIIENLKDKNPWLRYLIKNEDDFKLVATLKADTYGRPQYAIKCSPQIRRNIAACGDELNILGTFCKVYDKYHVLRCIKCQKFGHKHDLCRGELVCPKCGGEHWLRECISEVSTCLHCQGPHITGDRVCQKYKEEEASVKDRTDHGEHLEVFKPDLQSERAERENIAKQQKIIKQEAQRKKKKAKSNITVVLGDQVIITNLCKTRKYKKDMYRYFNLIDTLQLTE
ncbi:uncharacterized protein LOC135217034 isoform X1 [Macrobrachium nipponense]|uniref:uncharacterized protein LOC135217034 isoform X1 n=1 Tax=Macrobrachium nipponense TaxID=159736 RepID=UPI0030C7C7AD